MRRLGRIVAATGADRARVALDPGSACARCARGRGCGAALFAPPGEPIELDCTLERSPGEPSPRDPARRVGARVEVELPAPGSGWLVPLALAYGLPTAGIVLGILAPEPWTPFAALGGLGLGLFGWRVANARLARAGSTAGEGAVTGPCRPRARILPLRERRLRSGAAERSDASRADGSEDVRSPTRPTVTASPARSCR